MNDSNSPQETSPSPSSSPNPAIGRNEPCPCGSGKKYKRCHGQDAVGIIGAPKAPALPAGGDLPFDPSQMDPAMLAQMTQAMQRLPKAQLHKIQTVMTRAMQGKDVTREAAELEKMLPGGFKSLMESMAPGMAGLGGMGGGTPAPEMTEAEARKLVEQAAKEGKISAEEAAKLLAPTPPTDTTNENATAGSDGVSSDDDKKGLFKKFFKK